MRAHRVWSLTTVGLQRISTIVMLEWSDDAADRNRRMLQVW